MKTKRVFLAVCLTALVLTIVLISVKAYYVAIALALGTLIIGYRELWALIRTRKMPPIDERVKENTSRSIRNGFIFFAIASAFLMLLFSINTSFEPEIIHLLAWLFLSAAAVYALSYIFYAQAEPNLGERGLKMLKILLMTAGLALAVFILSVFLHNAISGLLGVEEPVFFIIATILSPLAFAVGLVGSLVIFIKGLLVRTT